jgi:hypothetical protein
VMEAATVGEGGARRDSYRSLLQVPCLPLLHEFLECALGRVRALP